MTELETLQNAVTTAQTAYDNAVKTFNVSKKRKQMNKPFRTRKTH